MKRQKLWVGIPGLILAFGIFFTGCPQPVDNNILPKSSDATLREVTVAGQSAVLGKPHEEWNSENLKTGVVVLAAEKLTDAAVAVTKTEDEAYVYYAKAGIADIPSFVEETVFTFSNEDYLYIEVYSPNKDKVLFYKIQVLTPADVSTVDRISIGGAVGTRGTPAAAWNDAGLAPGVINLTTAQAENVEIDLVLTNQGAGVEYAKVTGEGEPTFSSQGTFTFTQGDYLYIKVTSSDGTSTTFYKLLVNVGNVATISSLSVGGVDANMPVPAAALEDLGAPARILFKTAQPEGGFEVVTKVTNNADAVVTFARAAGSAEPQFGETSTFVFNDRDYLYVKAASGNGSIVNYYKWQIFLLQTATIPYGSPSITSNSTPGTVNSLTIDSLWDSVDWLPEINRIAVQDSIPEYINEVDEYGVSTHTKARAKLMWDLTGVYLYVEVTDDNVNTSNVGGSNQAWWDSVELCVNENIGYTGGSYETAGGLYRKGYGAGNNTVSGGPSAGITAFNALGKHASGKTDTGYAVIMQVPWRFNNLDNEWGPVYNGKKIGLDIVIDDSRGAGGNTGVGNANGRRGVIAWNNSYTASAQVDNSAVITLAGAPTNIITDLAITGSQGPRAALGTPAAAWNDGGLVSGNIIITPPALAVQAAVNVARSDPDYTSVRYAKAAGTAAPVFGVSNIFTFNDGDFLYLEVNAPGRPTNIYKLQVGVKSNNADLTGITFSSPLSSLPEPASTWSDAVAILHTVDQTVLVNPVTVVVTKGNEDAVVKYTSSSTAAGTVTWGDSAALTVSTGDYVGIQVTAAAEIPVKYYKFRVSNGTSSAAGITGVTVAGKEPNSLGVPGDAHNAAVAGDIHLTSAQITAGREIVVTSTDIVSIRVGTSTYNFLEPSDYVSLTKTGNTYTGTIPGTGFVASPWAPAPSIVVEVTSENKIAVKFYKFVVTTADNAALTGLTVGGVDVTGLGTPAGAWNSSNLVNGTVTLTSAQATGAAVVPTATNGGTITYAVTTDAGTEPTFAGLPEGGFNLTNGSFLYIKLEYTTVDGNTYRNIYRISITVS